MSIIAIKKQDYQPAQSAAALAKATQTFIDYQDSQATDVVGFFLTGPVTRIIGLSAIFTAALAAAESITVQLRKIDKDTGALVILSSAIVLDSTNTAAGTIDLSDNLLPAASGIQPGDVLRLTRTYVAGGGPADPEAALVVQAGF